MANSTAPADSASRRPDDNGLPAKIEQALAEAVPQPQKRQEVRRQLVSYVHDIQEVYSGPLPHPGHLEQFERTLPGSADRIIALAEREQAHRHAWEQRELRSSALTERIGLIGGIFVAVSLIVGAVLCAIYNMTAIGTALVATTAASMVPAIIKGRDWLKPRGQTGDVATPVPSRPQPRKNPRRR
jgi:uncharacterized membrane protein